MYHRLYPSGCAAAESEFFSRQETVPYFLYETSIRNRRRQIRIRPEHVADHSCKALRVLEVCTHVSQARVDIAMQLSYPRTEPHDCLNANDKTARNGENSGNAKHCSALPNTNLFVLILSLSSKHAATTTQRGSRKTRDKCMLAAAAAAAAAKPSETLARSEMRLILVRNCRQHSCANGERESDGI